MKNMTNGGGGTLELALKAFHRSVMISIAAVTNCMYFN